MEFGTQGHILSQTLLLIPSYKLACVLLFTIGRRVAIKLNILCEHSEDSVKKNLPKS